jgi:hypothetical protein
MTRMLAFAAALLAISRTTAAQSAAVPAPPAPPAVTMPVEIPPPPPAAAPAAAAPPPAAAAPAVAPPPPAPAPAAAPPPPAAAPAAPPPPPAPAAQAQAEPKPKSPRGKLYTWGSIGTTFAYGNTYGSLNLGLGYLMKAGITPNAELSYSFGASPTIWSFRPGLTWYLPVPVLSPYIGGFYTHWFVSGDQPDQDGLGARAGFSLGLVSLGITYEKALSCSKNCEAWTPQIAAGLSF